MSELARALLTPRSVALIGASDDLTKTAARPLRYLRRAGFAGAIYPVNPRRKTVLGERAWPSVAKLPERPDHAYVLAPTEGAVDAVEECGEAGIPVATVLASGFAEAGPAGMAREERLRAICARTGLRLVGPSSLGVVNVRERLLLTANAAFAETDLPVGSIFAASQSGSMIGALVSRGKVRGFGFASLVSVGNEADLGIGEICAATLDDPEITGYLLFLETIRQSEALRAFAYEAARRSRPIVAYKLGRSQEAQELAISHTGALAGEDDVASAFLADCGIARVDTFEGLLEALPLLARLPARTVRARKPRVGVVTTTGGGAAMVVDQLATRGVSVEAPSRVTLERLAQASVAAAPGLVLDLTLAGTRYAVMKGALDVLLEAPEFDAVVAVVGSSARFQPDLAVQPVIDSAGRTRPLAAFIVPEAPEALAALSKAGIPNFRTPEACADVIAAAFGRREARPPAAPKPLLGGRSEARALDELEAYEVLDGLKVPRGPAIVIDANIASAPVLPFEYPVAAKILAGAAHKSDIGGVMLDVKDGAALIAACRRLREAFARHRPGNTLTRVLVQPMISGVAEFLVGYRRDPLVGPIVLVSAGGVMAEVFRDRAIRLAPVEHAEARRMVEELRSFELLSGFRGKPKGDVDALAAMIVALSRLALPDAPLVREAEVNPVIVRRDGEGALAVDALVVLDRPYSR